MEESEPPRRSFPPGRSQVSSNWRLKDDTPRVEGQPQPRTQRNVSQNHSNGGNEATESGNVPENRLYVGNLLYTAQRQEVEAFFTDHGFNITGISMSIDPFTNRNRSYAFVDFETTEDAQRAMAELNGQELLGRPVKINPGMRKEVGSTSSQSRNPDIDGQRRGADRAGNRASFQENANGSNRAPNNARPENPTRLYLGNLPSIEPQEALEAELANLFQGFQIKNVSRLIAPHESRAEEPGNHHYCFVDLESAEEVDKALETLGGQESPWGGELRISKARDNRQKRQYVRLIYLVSDHYCTEADSYRHHGIPLRLYGKSLNWGNGSSNASVPPVNKTMFQGFEWYTASNHNHWRRLATILPVLRDIGIDMIWIPPGSKAASAKSNGYDIYDLYDLGEFDQKGGRETKWGSKEDLIYLCEAARKEGIGILWDAVLNHRAGADGTDTTLAVKCNPKDRRKEISAADNIKSWTRFDFPGREEQYSDKKYTAHDFSGVDYDDSRKSKNIYKFVGPGKNGWAEDVDGELGNYDYLMFADVDYSQPSVREDVLKWSVWITRELGLSGFRLDASKHYSLNFQKQLVQTLDQAFGKNFFVVAEYWNRDSLALGKIIGKFKGRVSLFDVQLVYNLSDISSAKPSDPKGDLRRVFEGTLVSIHPQRAVTFVANHDTQEGQSLAAPVEEWFVPHAYALILLRQDGYPCVFYGDAYGINGPRPRHPAAGGRVGRIIAARNQFAYGKQKDYFDQADCIGWVRSGHISKSDGAGLAVLLNSSWEYRWKKMSVGKGHAKEKWSDVMGWAWGDVTIDEFGFGLFPVGPRAMGIWVRKDARGREKMNRLLMQGLE
ncbi:hypothetical protein DV738_g4198, partial [Chaetothyriales sp. CBS 135597]